MYEGMYEDMGMGEVRQVLAEKGLKNFVYLTGWRKKWGYYDPEGVVWQVLDERCGKRKSILLDGRKMVFVYRECEFGGG